MKSFFLFLALSLIVQTSSAMSQSIEGLGKPIPAPPLPVFSAEETETMVPPRALAQATEFYERNIDQITNKRYITIVDLSKHSSKLRMYVIDMATGTSRGLVSSHGKGSDKDADGYAERFSNQINSEMSSLGFYYTAESYSGKNGYSLRLDGLESSNDNARERGIVMHGASYVEQDKTDGGYAGRSQGCPAVDQRYNKTVIDDIKNGSLFYIWAGQ
jgi:hypothetical protein